MSKNQNWPRVAAFRIEDGLYEALEAFGRAQGFLKGDGDVNISSTVVFLLAVALRDIEGQALVRTMYELGRNQVLERLKERWHEVMSHLAAEI